jgi:translocation and assembly module TamB
MLAPAATKGAWAKVRRIARRAAWVSCVVLLGVTIAALGLLVYLQTAAGRRFVAAKVSELVSHELVADLRIERLDVISADRIVAARATLVDAHGRPLLAVSGLEARFQLTSLLAHIFFGPEIRVIVPEVSAERLEVGLYRDEKGDLLLEHAFESQTPSPTPRAGRPLRLGLPRINAKAVSVANDLPGLAHGTCELGDLNASLEVAPGSFALALESKRLRVANVLPVELRAALDAKLRFPGTTVATLGGSLGALPVTANFQARGAELTLGVSSPSLAPDGVRKLWPEWPLALPLAASADISGPLGALRGRVEAKAGASTVVASGPVGLDPLSVKLAFEAHALDLRVLGPDAPSTALATEGELEFRASPAPRVEVTARSLEGELAGVKLPKTSAHAVFAERRLTGNASVLERSLPLELTFARSPEGNLDFHARAQELGLAALAPYGLEADGRANAEVAGTLAQGELDVRFDAELRALRGAAAEAQSVSAHGVLRGSTARPRELGAVATARATNLAFEGVRISKLELESKGPLLSQRVVLRANLADGHAWTASGDVAFGSGVNVSDARVEAALGGAELRLDVERARIEPHLVDVPAFKLELGDGAASGTARFDAAERRVELAVTDFDPAPLASSFGFADAAFGGRVDARLAFVEDARGRRAKFEGSLENGSVGGVSPVFAELTASLDGSTFEGEGTIGASGVGQSHWHGHATLAPHPVSLDTLSTTTGELRVDVSEIDLAELARRWLPSAAPGLGGEAKGSLWLARREPAQPLEAGYELDVHALTLGSSRSAEAPPLVRVDVSSQGMLDAAATRVDLDVKDEAGVWLKSRAELGRSGSRELELLRTGRIDEVLAAPLRAELVVLPRKLGRFGGADRPLPRGDLSGGVSVRGTLGRPRFDAKLTVSHLRIAGIGAESELSALLEYSAEREEYAVNVQAVGSGVRKLDLTGGGHAGWVQHGFGSDFSLESHGRADRVALAPLGDIAGIKLGGELTGKGSLTASASSFDAAGDFSVNGLVLERRALGSGGGSFSVHHGLAEGRLRIGDERAKVELSSELGLDWSGGTPRVDPGRGGNVQAELRNYELSMLAPLLRAFASEVSGPINGFASLEWGPEDKTGKRRTKLRANASVSGGKFRLSHGTGSIQNAELRALANGDDTLHLTFTGSASSKEPDLSAKADVLWDGLLPRRVEAELRAKRFPVSYEGVLLGTATIEQKAPPIRVVLDLRSAEQRVEINVPALEFELPTKEDTRLIELVPDPSVRVTDVNLAPEIAAPAPETSSVSISVVLGDGVRVKQPDLLVPVTGKLSRASNGNLDGALVLPEGGTVSAFGQVFRLKRSSVRFENQPVELGALSIQASARTVEGIVVDLDVSGTVKKPVVRFRSDPPRSEAEIISLLLGIRPDDSSAVPGQQGVGGSAMALAMNQLLRNSPLAGFQFGETQSRTGDTTSTVSFRAGNKVWLEGWSTRQNQGTPYEATRSSGVVDWRFAPGFSLRTQLGYPSGVEMRWSHRY